MNNKAEYNYCAWPRLTAKQEENDREICREQARTGMERETTITVKIRKRKKEKAKKRWVENRRM